MARLNVSSAAPVDRLRACRLALGHAPSGEPDGRAERLCAVIHRGDFDPAGLLVVRRDGTPVGAIAAQVLPGGTGVLLPPFAPDPEASAALLDAALAHFRRAGVAIAHCALRDDEASQAAPLLGVGFRPVTKLVHMIRPGPIFLRPPNGLSTDLNFIPYTDAMESSFGATLLRTYIGSLDLPEATVDRPAAQILAGYRQGQSEPPRWWSVEGPKGDAVGVVILNAIDASAAVELVYLGIVPEHRRVGHGRSLIRHALAEAQRAGAADVALSIDARNVAAMSLYGGELFRVCGSQQLYLMRLEPSGSFRSGR